MLDQPLEQILDTPEVQHVFDEHQARRGGAQPAGADRAGRPRPARSPSTTSTSWPTRTRPAAHRVTYHRDMFSEHLLLHPMSAPMTLRWLTDRFTGEAADRAPGPDEVADAAEPDDLRRHGAAGEDRREGRHWADGRALSAVTGGPSGCSTGGQAPRSSRCVDTAISA